MLRRLPDSTTRAPPRRIELRRLCGSTGDSEWSRCSMLYDTVGEPKEDDREGGGTDGYVSPREGAPKVTPPGLNDVGGLVRLLLTLT